MNLTERDKQIIQKTFDYRLISSEMLYHLIGPRPMKSPKAGNPKARKQTGHSFKRRLKTLTDWQYLERLKRTRGLWQTGVKTYGELYIIGPSARQLLESEFEVPLNEIRHQRQEPTNLEHMLEVSRFRTTLELALRGSATKLSAFRRESRRLYERFEYHDPKGRRRRTYIHPDGFFTIELTKTFPAAHFLELDRGTMSLRRWQSKIRGYRLFFKTERYKEWNLKGFRVVVITPDERRRDQLIEQTRAIDASDRYFFSTFQHYHFDNPQALLQPIFFTLFQNERSLLELPKRKAP